MCRARFFHAIEKALSISPPLQPETVDARSSFVPRAVERTPVLYKWKDWSALIAIDPGPNSSRHAMSLGIACSVISTTGAIPHDTGTQGQKCEEALPGCWASFKEGVRTGGRLHSGQAGERLLKQRPLVYLARCRSGDCVCLRFSGQLRLRRPLPRTCTAAAATTYIPQQPAARTGQAWVSGLGQGKGDRTGGRLHPGLAGE